MIPEKKCFGNGIAIGYGCGKLVSVSQRKYGLGRCCLNSFLTQTKAGKLKLSKSSIKVQYQSNAQKTDVKIALSETKSLVHLFVKLRDLGKPCICCLKPYNVTFQASHFFKAELYETLRFNLDNIHSGCPQCNIGLDGNLTEYAKNLPVRIGIERFEQLKSLSEIDKQQSKVWNLENLQEIQNDISQQIENNDISQQIENFDK